MAKSLEGFQPMFGKPKAEWEVPSSLPLLPFMFHVHALDSFHLRVHVTDFQSCTWAATRSIEQLEDLRDDIGIGGSWSDFIDYLIASVRSENVKLVLSRPSKSSGGTGPMFAKLIAHKSKGMPLISIALDRIMDSTANDAMANLSLELFKAYETKHNLVVKEQERTCWLTQILSAEKRSRLSKIFYPQKLVNGLSLHIAGQK
uniref:Uncharacterized protein n=1 Tax=Nelumbo nucifera TaxID=4432 RepID=A0A822Z855_NELNU|nr:TPA_asm: hypothetical protein HUJ06_014174 [Nelumbo nucifera]